MMPDPESTIDVESAGDAITIDTADNIDPNLKESFTDIDEGLGTDDLKPCTYMGIKFPIYFQGPHWIQLKGAFVLAVDPKFITMEMKANWMQKYVPELVALGKEVLEKNLNIKIQTI